MTREQVKKSFPDATEEQIDAILDVNSSDIGKAKKSVISEEELSGLKKKAKEHDDYLESQKTEQEKLQNLLAEAEKAKLDNLKMLNKTKAASAFVSAGITEEEYSSFIDGIVSDDETSTVNMANNLINVFKSKMESVKEQLLKETPPPQAGGGKIDFTKQIEEATTNGNTALAASLIRQQAIQPK